MPQKEKQKAALKFNQEQYVCMIMIGKSTQGDILVTVIKHIVFVMIYNVLVWWVQKISEITITVF